MSPGSRGPTLLGVVMVFCPVLAAPEPPMSLAASEPAPVVLGLWFCGCAGIVLWVVSVGLVAPRSESWLVVEELSPPYTPAVEPAAASGSGLAASAVVGNATAANSATVVIFIPASMSNCIQEATAGNASRSRNRSGAYLASGVVSVVSLASSTNTASSFAGSVALAFSLTR